MKKERHSRRLKEGPVLATAGIYSNWKSADGCARVRYCRGGAVYPNAVRELHIEFRRSGAECCKRSPSTPVATSWRRWPREQP